MSPKAKPKRTWDRGKPRHVPTDVSRAQVSSYQIVGVPHHEIAGLMGISIHTLLKYYADELRTSKHKANAIVNQRLFNQTKTSAAAAIFWHKAQMGWRETMAFANDPRNPLTPTPAQLPEQISEEDAMQAYISLVKGGKR